MMSRRLVFLIALLSVSVPRHDYFADGFLALSGIQQTPPSTLTLTSASARRRIHIIRAGNLIPTHVIIRRRARLFSQTTKQSTEQEEPLVTSQPTTTKSSIPSSISSSISPPSINESTTTKKTTPITKKSSKAAFSKFAAITEGPDLATKPDYENIHGPLGKTIDNIFLYVFRTKLAEYVGVDSKLAKTDFNGLIELSAALNSRYSDRLQIQTIAQQTLRSLFPSWLPPQFAILFARPFPEFSSRMNAWATWVAGQWLMGECEINDIEIDGKTMKDQGLLVKRCRFLEESGCASVCVNSCKIPTQKFFIEDMGLPLTMTPDYETHECQFSFGRMPTQQDDLDAMGTPCLSRCPTAGSMRQWHNGNGAAGKASSNNTLLENETTPPPEMSSQCSFMENPPGGDEKQLLQP